MEFKRGTIVRSKAGRDQGDWFIVLSEDENAVYLVDGKRRPIERPKCKKKKHCAATLKCVTLPEEPIANKTLRNLLKQALSNFEIKV